MISLRTASFLLAVALAAAGTLRASEGPRYLGSVSHVRGIDQPESTGMAPNFTWLDSHGKPVSLQELRGKVVFLNFWGTWCRPCRMELPDIVSLEKTYHGRVVFIGVALERPGGDPLQGVSAFVGRENIPYQMVIGTPTLARLYGGISGIPTTFIIGRDGKIVGQRVGMQSRDEFERMLKSAL